MELPEAAAWLREALTAYQQADYRTAGQKLAQLGRHLAGTRPADFQSPVATAQLVILDLIHEATAERALWLEEVLLGLVAVRELLHHLAERG